MSDRVERVTEDSELEETRPEIDIEAERVEEAEVREIAASPGQGRRGGRGALFFSLLALLLVAGGLAVGYQQWQRIEGELTRVGQSVDQSTRQRGEIKSGLESVRQAFDSQAQQLDRERKRFAERNVQLEKERLQLQRARERVQRQNLEMRDALEAMSRRVGNDSDRWIAAEADYLMQVASTRLQLAGDVPAAILALQAADARLRDSGDPGWIGVRELLTTEISRLKGVQVPDLAGLSARLTSLAQQVDSLEMPGAMTQPEVPPTQSESVDAGTRNLDTLLHDAWRGFKSVMVIRRRGTPMAATLPPEQHFFVRQNLRLQLQSARFALLLRDQALYRLHLQTASRWLQEFFDPEQAGTGSTLEALDKLQQVQLEPEMPDITGSLIALRKRLKSEGEEGEAQ